MKILSLFSVLFFGGVLLNLLPYDWPSQMSANLGLIGFFVAFAGFILSLSFLAPMLFEDKLAAMKKYIYVAVVAFTACLTIDVLLKWEVYELFRSTVAQYVLLGGTSAVVLFCLARIHLYAKERGVDLSQVNWQFMKLGASLEDTPVFKAITRLDRYFVVFAVVSVLVESVQIFIGITALLLVLSAKDVQIVFKDFKVHLANKKAVWTVVLFYSSYVMAVVVEMTLEKEFLTILAASFSMLLIKLYYHEIVKETLRSEG